MLEGTYYCIGAYVKRFLRGFKKASVHSGLDSSEGNSMIKNFNKSYVERRKATVRLKMDREVAD